jgi:hypothetical protein
MTPLTINNQQSTINTCHLILTGCGALNYISRSALLNQFIEELINVCNYSSGVYSGDLFNVKNIYLDVQPDLQDFCLEHHEYIPHGKLFAVSFNQRYSNAVFLIDPKLFKVNHTVLIDIALSMIATVHYAMSVTDGNICPAHCAMVEINGKGALICAPGGTGKSTCASRLPLPHRALAEDCALVMQTGDDFIAQAMPAWSLITREHKKIENISFDCTVSIPLAGIFFLEQGKTDSVKALDLPTALGYLNSSFNDHVQWFLRHFPADEAKPLRINIFNLAERMVTALPGYRLSATLDGKFWDVIIEVMG